MLLDRLLFLFSLAGQSLAFSCSLSASSHFEQHGFNTTDLEVVAIKSHTFWVTNAELLSSIFRICSEFIGRLTTLPNSKLLMKDGFQEVIGRFVQQ